MTIIITSLLFAAILGALLALIIGAAAKAFAVEIDPRIETVTDMLPGANCGGCGYAGCADFAKAIVGETVPPTQCPVSSPEDARRIAEYLGITAEEKEKAVAVVRCSGGRSTTLRSPYNGITDCRSAVVVAGGAKGCDYGCIGFGSCARACPFGAIEIRDGLAVVHPDLCVGCGKCVDTCPKNLIVLVPAFVDVHVYCNSPEKGPVKRKVCKTACIACRKCVKAADSAEQMNIKGFLVETNYSNPPLPDLVEKAGCPTTALRQASRHAAGEYEGVSK
ncbi:MAG: H+/Na+-translocating ferredoxin:NAD+ oxidoreductase subunit [Verrucomicrobiota bacterium]|jgi:Na+-translocating ferredoxin:NAD+ oxidoreductase RNF subunit RnfB|nr:H+/Na+-translocating ferredoxin:NAD+ oxidoreductase subunit [Verrucomicrobiota bacterium]MDK2963011.1 H+/Na+-translocating ferredoxin:NAD+ oxidoreductase subunit [Verrucomicrobiota bacterium]